LDAGLRLSGGISDFTVCLDDDDPALAGYQMARKAFAKSHPGRVSWLHGPRQPVTALVNAAALAPAGAGEVAAGFLGDDHLVRPSRDGTGPYDEALLACLAGGAPFAYGDDLHQGEALPTFVLADRRVVDALGWLCQPSLAHYFFDNVWRDLGARFVPGVVVEHRHHLWGTAVRDQTYADAEPAYQADKAAYEEWAAPFGQNAADRVAVQLALREAR
jgi:hypothetical protein